MNLGMGVMIGLLGGNRESAEAFTVAVGKRIAAVKLDESVEEDGALVLTFDDGSRLALYDDGRSCCESRYMRTDDNLAYHVGAQLLDAEVLDGPTVEEDYETHETAFLHVRTTKGVIVVNTHNDHNGYYGGILIRAKALPAEAES